MATFLKRQKEMKRLEKQREKAERRAQKKLAPPTPEEPLGEPLNGILVDGETGDLADDLAARPEPVLPH